MFFGLFPFFTVVIPFFHYFFYFSEKKSAKSLLFRKIVLPLHSLSPIFGRQPSGFPGCTERVLWKFSIDEEVVRDVPLLFLHWRRCDEPSIHPPLCGAVRYYRTGVLRQIIRCALVSLPAFPLCGCCGLLGYGVSSSIFFLQCRVWSWLRMNASYRLNTCKSRGSMTRACSCWWRPAHGCVTRIQPSPCQGTARWKTD